MKIQQPELKVTPVQHPGGGFKDGGGRGSWQKAMLLLTLYLYSSYSWTAGHKIVNWFLLWRRRPLCLASDQLLAWDWSALEITKVPPSPNLPAPRGHIWERAASTGLLGTESIPTAQSLLRRTY